MGIMGSSSKDDVVVLGGHEFKRTKNGLDEDQIASFVEDLIKERDRLAQSQDHIASLNRLAERAVVEADKLAVQIKTEATEQARAESAAIIDRAKEQARQMSEKKIAEAVELANEQANVIKAKAEEEAAILLENEKNRIRNDLRNLVNQQFGYLLEELEHLKQQAAAIQAEFENGAPVLGRARNAVPAGIREDKNAATMEAAKAGKTVVAQDSRKTIGEYVEPARDTAYTKKDFTLPNLLQVEGLPESGTPQWEVEILPPFEIAEIMAVVSFLDQLPEVANTEMIVPQIDVPLIMVFLRRPMNVVEVLQRIPAVAYVQEVAADKAATNGKPRKVRIGLAKDRKS